MKLNFKKLLGSLGKALVKKYGHTVIDKAEEEAVSRIGRAAAAAESKIHAEADKAREKVGKE